MSSSLSVPAPEPKISYTIDEPKKSCWCCCRKEKKLRHFHERALTQEEMDYSKILRIEKAAKKAFEEKK